MLPEGSPRHNRVSQPDVRAATAAERIAMPFVFIAEPAMSGGSARIRGDHKSVLSERSMEPSGRDRARADLLI
jgi:hypothetical protein